MLTALVVSFARTPPLRIHSGGTFCAASVTAFTTESPPFSADAAGTWVAFPSIRQALSDVTEGKTTAMDDNASNPIRTLRQKLGMTQEELAHELAVTVSTVNRWENAHAEPSKLAWKAIGELARKRGVSEPTVRRSDLTSD